MTRAQTTIMLCLGILAYGATGQAQDAPQTSQRPLTRGSEAQVEAAPVFEPQQVTAEDRPKIRDPRMSRPLALAHKAMREEDWLLALERAKGDGPLAVDMITWHALRSGLGTPTDVMSFLARRPDWPGLPYLKEKSELTMANAAVSDVLAFFEGYTPRTGTGALTLAKALRTTRQSEAADAVLVRAWTSLSLEAEEHDSFLSTHADLLAPYHDKRLDMTLWEGWTSNPRRMESLVSEGLWDLAQARMAMRATGAPGDMSEALTDNAGLAYERFLRAKGMSKRALLLERSTSAEALGQPAYWASARRPMARQLMRDDNLQAAYSVASTHFLGPDGGRDYADLEWLSGFLALRLGQAETALEHFQRFEVVALTPISAARSGYWLGRAFEALGQPDAAQTSYVKAARFPTAFYGLLAAEKAGVLLPQRLAGAQPEGDWRTASFRQSSVHQTAVLLLASGEDWLAERFWTHLAESQRPEQIALMGKMLDEIGQPHIQVMLGKRAAQAGREVIAPYFALPDFAQERWPVPTELVLAIARRESEFDPTVVSHAGARGLMQVMPATARDMADNLGLPYAQPRLIDDPAYNAKLGAEYLRQMAQRYGGNPVLMSIAYNAGPARVDRWQQRYGNPRSSRTDIVTWIEEIPFRETRNYVMRVTESLPVYRARLGLEPLPEPFSDMLKGSSLRPRAVEGE